MIVVQSTYRHLADQVASVCWIPPCITPGLASCSKEDAALFTATPLSGVFSFACFHYEVRLFIVLCNKCIIRDSPSTPQLAPRMPLALTLQIDCRNAVQAHSQLL